MPAGAYTPVVGARWGNNADCQGFEIRRARLYQLGAGESLAAVFGAEPPDGAVAYRGVAGLRRIEFYDDALNANVLVPRLDYNEQVSGLWAFNYNPGAASSFTVASIVRVDNLNAHYVADANSSNTGRAGSSAATANTVAIRDSNARILAGDPSGSTNSEVVTYGFMYSFIQGVRDPKQSVLVVYPSVLPAFTFNAGGNTITADANGAINPVDGQTLAVNDRIGIVFETSTNAKYNGLYIVTQVGDAGTPFILQRAVDANTDAEVTNGLQFWVTTGTAYGSSGWLLTTPDPITLNTTALTFVQNNGTAGITAGNGMVKVGNTLHAIRSSNYDAGAFVYAATTTTLTMVQLTGIIKGNGSSAPDAVLPSTTTGVTSGKIAKFSSTTPYLIDSIMTEAAAVITIAGGLTVTGATTLATSLTGMLKGASGVVSAVTGGTNRIAFWSDANTISSNSTFVFDGTNVGIGIAAPAQLLHLYTSGADPTAKLQITASRNAYGPVSALIEMYTGGSSGTADRLYIGHDSSASSTRILTLQGDGKVGFFNTVPTHTFEIAVVGEALFLGKNQNANVFQTIKNTVGGYCIFGVSDSSGGVVGSLAYSTFLVTENATALHLGVNDTSKITITAAGIVVVGSNTALSDGALNIYGGLTFNGAQTLKTSTGALTIATGALNGAIAHTPHGTGPVTFTSGATTGTGTTAAMSLVANSLTTGTGISATSSSLTTGSLAKFEVTGTAADDGQAALNVQNSGATASNAKTTYAAYFMNSRTNATSGTNVGILAWAFGAQTANYAIYIPAGTIALAGSSSGVVQITAAATITPWTLTLPISAGTASYALITNGSGAASWSILPVAGGGTGRVALYVSSVVGDGALASFSVTHNFGHRNVHVSVYETASPYQRVEGLVVTLTSTNAITVDFGFIPTSNQFTVVVT